MAPCSTRARSSTPAPEPRSRDDGLLLQPQCARHPHRRPARGGSAVDRNPHGAPRLEEGWGAWTGPYATSYGTWSGKIEDAGGRALRVFIRNPPACLQSHAKWACFHNHDDNGWWRIHLHHQPVDGDPNAVIRYVEQMHHRELPPQRLIAMLTRWKPGRPGKAGAAEAKELARQLEARIEDATRRRITAMATTFEALPAGWQERLENDATFVMEAASIAMPSATPANTPAPPTRPRCACRCPRCSCATPTAISPPTRKAASGSPSFPEPISDDGVRVMSRMLNVDMDEASPAYVRAAPKETHKAIVQLVERDGHPLHAMWHSHIMRGAGSTRPSGIDIANQERFCAMGWDEVLGGIFSLDGFVRVFSTARDFSFSVYGNGVDIVSDGPREKILKLGT